MRKIFCQHQSNDRAVVPARDVETLLDYLHGDVIPQSDLEAVAMWEYSRHDVLHLSEYAGRRSMLPSNTHEVKRYLWESAFYPRANWRELSAKRRALLHHCFWSAPAASVVLCRHAKRFGVLDDFRNRAEDRLRRNEPACVKGFGQRLNILINLDPSQGATQCLQDLKTALLATGIEFRLRAKPRGRGRAPADVWKRALFNLAIWRLDNWVGWQKGKEWTEHYRRRGSRRGKVGNNLLKTYWGQHRTVGPIYEDRGDWDKAIADSKAFLTKTFGPQGSGIIPATIRHSRSTPRFYHLGPQPMQVASLATELADVLRGAKS